VSSSAACMTSAICERRLSLLSTQLPYLSAIYSVVADWGSVGGGRQICSPSAAAVSRSANAVMFVKVLALSVVGGAREDGALLLTVFDGISSVKAGRGGSSLEGFLSIATSTGRGDDVAGDCIWVYGCLGGIMLRGREIARPIVLRRVVFVG
jgi:hypothetical protein